MIELTNREFEILELIAKGNSSEKISNILNISTLTVKTHRQNLLRKLKAQNSSELIYRAFAYNLL